MEKLGRIIQFLETTAPLNYQESYDNAGLITGNRELNVKGVTVSLDCTEAVIDDALQNDCNVIISHHPIVFSPIKKLNGSTYSERAIIKAIKNDVALYAIHTNLDNVFEGVNKKICETLNLKNLSVLKPYNNLLHKLVTFVPVSKADEVRNALFNAGAGEIGQYSHCSFNIEGTGTFMAGENANPFVGEKGNVHRETETRIELIYETHKQHQILRALIDSHPYEEVAYYLSPLDNPLQSVGSGMLGETAEPVDEKSFLAMVKDQMQTSIIRHTAFLNKPINRVAVCGGSGSFLLKDAINKKADVFITADFKYHQFFDADRKILVADIGHYESEQYTCNLLADLLKRNFSTFAVRLTKINTNPVNYF